MTYIKEIKEMIALMNENNLAEIEIEKDGLKIKLRRAGLSSGASEMRDSGPIIIERSVPPEAKVQEVKSAPSPKSPANQIKSPMVGTFYRAPSPDSPPFVEVDDDVEVGQVVCIIEAMKLMNEIKSEVKGKIVELLVENGNPVEFGQPLFIIETR